MLMMMMMMVMMPFLMMMMMMMMEMMMMMRRRMGMMMVVAVAVVCMHGWLCIYVYPEPTHHLRPRLLSRQVSLEPSGSCFWPPWRGCPAKSPDLRSFSEWGKALGP